MPSMFVGLIYLLFFLSGAAALVYQVVWVRSLTLVFGGSHLAVTAVLSIFMGGLAIGGYVVGRRVDRVEKPLRLYGLLELGIAASALVFAGLMRIYPSIYVALAQGRDEAAIYLTIVRMLFSVVALIVPTILMGGTLPVLSRFVSRQPEHLRSHLSFLYGFNTLGAVFGALLAGFVLLRLYAVSTTLYLAVATNVLIGVVSLMLQERLRRRLRSRRPRRRQAPAAGAAAGRATPRHTGALGHRAQRILRPGLRGALDPHPHDRRRRERVRLHHHPGGVSDGHRAGKRGLRGVGEVDPDGGAGNAGAWSPGSG